MHASVAYLFDDKEEQFIGEVKYQCKSKKYRQCERDSTTGAATIKSSFRSTLTLATTIK